MQELKIGRASDNDIVIDDPSVSRVHAVLSTDGKRTVIADLNSTNGTFVNGNRINGTAEIAAHDILKVGNSVIPWKNYITTETPRVSNAATTQVAMNPGTVSGTDSDKQNDYTGQILLAVALVALVVILFFILV